jgi:hypothetical protein
MLILQYGSCCGSMVQSVFPNAVRCNIEWICSHFKAIFRRLADGKSREINAEMQAKTP